VVRFEGEDLDGCSVTIRQFKGVINGPLLLGEDVQVTIKGKVIGVSIRENRRTGRLYRDHEVLIEEVTDDT
jgi:hypothetical protein